MTPDQIAKQVAAHALSGTGTLHLEFEVAPAPLRIDIVVEPNDAALLAERGALGALGARNVDAAPPLLIEAMSRAVQMEQLRACMNRQHALYQIKCREARRREEALPSFPHLCVVSAGRPETVMREFDFAPLPGFPQGFYSRSRGDATSLVVVPELPRTRDTIYLRLMGRRAALRGALEDVNALPESAYERTVVREALGNMLGMDRELWQGAKKEGAMEDAMDGYDPEEMAAICDFLRSWKDEAPIKLAEERRLGWQEGQQDGLQKGLQDGLQKGLQDGLQKGLQDGLQKGLRATFEARFGAPPPSLLPFFERPRSEASFNTLLTLVVSRPSDEVVAALKREE